MRPHLLRPDVTQHVSWQELGLDLLRRSIDGLQGVRDLQSQNHEEPEHTEPPPTPEQTAGGLKNT